MNDCVEDEIVKFVFIKLLKMRWDFHKKNLGGELHDKHLKKVIGKLKLSRFGNIQR